MLGVMLPTVASTSAAVTAIYLVVVYLVAIAAIYVRIAVEIVVVIDSDVIVPAPTRVPAPTSSPCCSHGDSDSEGNRHACRVIPWRRIVNGRIGVDRWAVHDDRIVAWNINDLRIGLLDDDDLFRFHSFHFYFLLFTRFQVAGPLSLLAHALHCLHDVALLRQKCIAEVGGPLDVIRQALDSFRKRGHGLDARVPRLLLHGVDECLVFQGLVFLQPLLELNEFQWVRRSGEYLSEHWVGIQRDRRYQRVKLIRRYRGSLLVRRGSWRR